MKLLVLIPTGKMLLMRFKVGRLLEEKYGIKRCIVFCGIRDAFADAKSNAKYAFKVIPARKSYSAAKLFLGGSSGLSVEQ